MTKIYIFNNYNNSLHILIMISWKVVHTKSTTSTFIYSSSMECDVKVSDIQWTTCSFEGWVSTVVHTYNYTHWQRHTANWDVTASRVRNVRPIWQPKTKIIGESTVITNTLSYIPTMLSVVPVCIHFLNHWKTGSFDCDSRWTCRKWWCWYSQPTQLNAAQISIRQVHYEPIMGNTHWRAVMYDVP